MTKKKKAQSHKKKGLKITPERKKFSIQEKEQLAARMIDAGQLDEAELICRNLGKKGSGSAMTFHLLGVIALRKNQPGRAAEMLRRSIRRNPADPQVNLRLGMALYTQGDYEGAIESYRKTLELNPTNPYAHYNLGHVYFEKKSWKEAINAYNNAIKYKPDYFEAHNNLGVIYKDNDRPDEALFHFNRVVEINPNFADAYYNLGSLWTSLDKLDKAEECFRKAYQINPEHQDAAACLGGILDLKGDRDEAFRLLDPIIGSNNLKSHLAVQNYTRLCCNVGKFYEALDVLQRFELRSTNDLITEKAIYFSLGYVYDKLHRYDDAFENFQKANDIRARFFPYRDDHEGWEKVMKVFLEHTLPTSHNESDLPVFILGMPRSGTSLTEQILASHPLVHGGGELKDIKRIVEGLPSILHTNVPVHESFPMLTPEILDNLAGKYLAMIKDLKKDDRIIRVTDKMPGNFMLIGFIHLLFPQAKIIHCTRNSIDTCLSIYMNDFRRGHPYRNKLKTLGEYYSDYRKLMDFWKNEMHIEMFELPYEEMIDDQEGMSRALVDYCGLEWNDSCLGFHKSDRLVHTASYEQVRKPIYTSSVERWRNYEKYLQPLIQVLKKNHIIQ